MRHHFLNLKRYLKFFDGFLKNIDLVTQLVYVFKKFKVAFFSDFEILDKFFAGLDIGGCLDLSEVFFVFLKLFTIHLGACLVLEYALKELDTCL